MKRFIALLFGVCLCFAAVRADAASDVRLNEKYTYSSSSAAEDYVNNLRYPYYSDVLAGYDRAGYVSGTDSVIISPGAIAHGGAAEYETNYRGRADECYIWRRGVETIAWEFEIASAGLYEIELEYLPLVGSGNPVARAFKLDGDYPFIEATNITFLRAWADAGEPVVNNLGDETRPSQVEISEWGSVRLHDSTGFYSLPFVFWLEPGRHELEMEYIDQEMAVGELKIVPITVVRSYAEVYADYARLGLRPATKTAEFQAQLTVVSKSDPVIRRESAWDPMTLPYSSRNRLMNVMGGWRWRKGGQSITWEFYAPESGLYKIGNRIYQFWSDGTPAMRKIEIDGEVPFTELLYYKYPYEKWRCDEFSNSDGEPFLFYLTEGRHTITMTNVMGDLAGIAQSLNDDTILLSQILIDIYKITGQNPDPNYNYEFFRIVPDLKTRLQRLSDSMAEKYDEMLHMSDGKISSMAANFMSIKAGVDLMIRDPFSIAKNFKVLENAQTNLGAWYQEIQSQPMMIDFFKIMPPDYNFKNIRTNFFQAVKTTWDNFLISFVKDYDSVGSVLDESVEIYDTINVWVSRGMEYAEIIKEMADGSFTPKNGIAVNVNVLPAGQLGAISGSGGNAANTAAGTVNALMLSVIAGRAPDVAISVATQTPVEFAIRDAIYDLSQFPEYKEIEGRFLNEIMTPFKYNGGVYALPETMEFSALYFRKDIVADLGIPIPNTRQELYAATLPALYQNGLEFWYPQDFTHFLFQHGGSFYTEDGMRSGLDTREAYLAFKEYTEIYTNYGVPTLANFYNRFRQGIMPMGIGSFGLYMQLSVAAPELNGRWGIAPLPGTLKEDGVVDRSNGTLASSCNIIINQRGKADKAWLFLDWWTDAETQTAFCREIEAVIGTEARWNTATVEAFSNLSWKASDFNVIREQWQWARETPIVLGGYYTNRYVMNAWTSVVISGEELRNTLELAVKEINRELRMKQEEYGQIAE